jgi:hypothetical protein
MNDKDPKVIDITKILEKKKMISELVDGINFNVTETTEQDFKYLLKGFLEKDYHHEVSYNRKEDLMSVRGEDGTLICNVSFTIDKVFVLLPPNYIGSSMEKSALGRCYKLVSSFCSSWNNLTQGVQ